MNQPKRVPVDSGGHVRCPSCGDHFEVESAVPQETRRPSGPCCPKCGATLSLDSVLVESSGIGWVGQEKMYYCPHCLTVLGFTAWKR
jgi:NAD-dependent SIR2 family protein deacetylase